MAAAEPRQTRLLHKANQDMGKGRRQVTPRQAARGAYRGTTAPVRAGGRLGRQYSARGMLTAELLTGVAIVAVRAVEDYKPGTDPVTGQPDGSLKGTIAHPAGQYGPLPILAGLLTWFFLLSFLAARGGTRAKVAVVAGGLTDLVLAMKSMPHFEKVAATFGHFGTVQLPPGDWQTSGPIAGQADTAAGVSASGGSSAGQGSAGPGSASPNPVTQDQQALARNANAKTPNPGLPYIEAQLKTAEQVIKETGTGGLSSLWPWLDKHLFGGKSFWNGL